MNTTTDNKPIFDAHAQQKLIKSFMKPYIRKLGLKTLLKESAPKEILVLAGII